MTGEFFVRLDGPMVAVGGEVDTYTSPELARALDDAVRADGRGEVVVDVAEVTFIDSSGLAALIGAAKQARAHGVGYRVANANRNLRRLFELAGLDDILGVG